ncbi:hypothetical protein BY996DRAFT_8209035, partial [Phakopsora pachyrhizi]
MTTVCSLPFLGNTTTHSFRFSINIVFFFIINFVQSIFSFILFFLSLFFFFRAEVQLSSLIKKKKLQSRILMKALCISFVISPWIFIICNAFNSVV